MRAVFFDLYETLVTQFDPDWVPPPQSIAERLSIEERIYEELWRRFEDAWMLGEIGEYEEVLSRICAAAGKEASPTLLSELAWEHRRRKAQPFDVIEPEILDMVTALKQCGLKLGVISNVENLGSAPWSGSALAPLFDDFVASHQVGLLKPDKKIYELACRRLDIQPVEGVFVGDGGANELDGATQAGLEAIWCSWFLDRWPEWHQYRTKAAPPYERLTRPLDLIGKVVH